MPQRLFNQPRPVVTVLTVLLCLTPTVVALAQSNDSCSSPLVIDIDTSSPMVVVSYDLSQATPTPNAACPQGDDLWFRFTAVATAWAYVWTRGPTSLVNHKIAAFADSGSGCPSAADVVVCTSTGSLAHFPVVNGQSYLLCVGRQPGEPLLGELWSSGYGGPPPPTDDRYRLKAPTLICHAGQTVTGTVLLDSTAGAAGAPEGIRGWSFGLCHDENVIGIVDAVLGTATATINNNGPPQFSAINLLPEGVTVGAVINFGAMIHILPGVDHELYEITYEGLDEGFTTDLEFCHTLGAPPVAVLVANHAGDSSHCVSTAGSVEVIGHDFVRGDCDNSGGAVNLADAVSILFQAFPLPSTTPAECADACDIDDSGTLSLVDAILLLNGLFNGGMLPPGGCGPDPTTDSLLCVSAPCP